MDSKEAGLACMSVHAMLTVLWFLHVRDLNCWSVCGDVFILSAVKTRQPLLDHRGFSEPINFVSTTMVNPDTGNDGEQSAVTAQNKMETRLTA